MGYPYFDFELFYLYKHKELKLLFFCKEKKDSHAVESKKLKCLWQFLTNHRLKRRNQHMELYNGTTWREKFWRLEKQKCHIISSGHLLDTAHSTLIRKTSMEGKIKSKTYIDEQYNVHSKNNGKQNFSWFFFWYLSFNSPVRLPICKDSSCYLFIYLFLFSLT